MSADDLVHVDGSMAVTIRKNNAQLVQSTPSSVGIGGRVGAYDNRAPAWAAHLANIERALVEVSPVHVDPRQYGVDLNAAWTRMLTDVELRTAFATCAEQDGADDRVGPLPRDVMRGTWEAIDYAVGWRAAWRFLLAHCPSAVSAR